jgi:acrylyl-CoA reductase (NADPH)
MTFKALLVTRTGETNSTDLVDMREQDLMAGNVVVSVDYSTVNSRTPWPLPGGLPSFVSSP